MRLYYTKLPPTATSKNAVVSIIPHDSTSDLLRPLMLRCIPIPLTIDMFDGKFLVDPSSEEEAVLDGMLTVAMASRGQAVSVNKPGGAFMSLEDLAACLTFAKGRAKEMENALLLA